MGESDDKDGRELSQGDLFSAISEFMSRAVKAQAAIDAHGFGPPEPPEGELAQARRRFWSGIEEPSGCTCEVCGRWARIHRRRITAGAAGCAMWMLKYHRQEWVHVAAAAPKQFIENREYNRLGYWGLLEAQPNVSDPSKRTLGIWRLTDSGVEWVRQRRAVPAWVEVYDDRVVRVADDVVYFAAAMGEHFDYEDFLANL